MSRGYTGRTGRCYRKASAADIFAAFVMAAEGPIATTTATAASADVTGHGAAAAGLLRPLCQVIGSSRISCV